METLLVIGLLLVCPITMFFMMRGHIHGSDDHIHGSDDHKH